MTNPFGAPAGGAFGSVPIFPQFSASGLITGGGADQSVFAPPFSNSIFIATRFDAVFDGDGGGGWLELRDSSSGRAFWSTVPTGGNVEWDHWEGFQVFTYPTHANVHCPLGTFEYRASGWWAPVTPTS